MIKELEFDEIDIQEIVNKLNEVIEYLNNLEKNFDVLLKSDIRELTKGGQR